MNSRPWPPEVTEAQPVESVAGDPNVEASLRRALATLENLIRQYNVLLQVVQGNVVSLSDLAVSLAATDAIADAAYAWGNHALAGYATQTWVTVTALPAYTGSANLATAGTLVATSVEAAEYMRIPHDNKAFYFGDATDALMYYNGTDFVINPRSVGTGNLSVLGGISIPLDNVPSTYGAENDAGIYYDGTNLVLDPRLAGSGALDVRYGLYCPVIVIPTDAIGLVLGAGQDVAIYYDGTDLVINPKVVGSGAAYVSGILQADQMEIPADNAALYFGAAGDADLYYDGINLICNPKVVGAGILDVLGVVQTDGYKSSDGTAGASATTPATGLVFKDGLYTSGSLGTASLSASGDFAPAAGSSSIITVGTITTGVWNAGAITSSGVVSGTYLKPTTGYKAVDDTVGATATTPAAGLVFKNGIYVSGTLGTAALAASGDFSPAAGSASIITVGTVTTGTWNAGAVTSSGTVTGAHLKDTSLTSGRIPYVTAGGQLADTVNLNWGTTGIGVGKTAAANYAIDTAGGTWRLQNEWAGFQVECTGTNQGATFYFYGHSDTGAGTTTYIQGFNKAYSSANPICCLYFQRDTADCAGKIVFYTRNAAGTLNACATLSQAGIFSLNYGCQTPLIYALADSTTGITFCKADGTTVVATLDTTNSVFSAAHLKDTSLTAGYVAYATTGGQLATTAGLSWNGTILGATAMDTANLSFSTSIKGPVWKPASDGTAAIKITKADGSTAVLTVDTTNRIVYPYRFVLPQV